MPACPPSAKGMDSGSEELFAQVPHAKLSSNSLQQQDPCPRGSVQLHLRLGDVADLPICTLQVAPGPHSVVEPFRQEAGSPMLLVGFGRNLSLLAGKEADGSVGADELLSPGAVLQGQGNPPAKKRRNTVTYPSRVRGVVSSGPGISRQPRITHPSLVNCLMSSSVIVLWPR